MEEEEEGGAKGERDDSGIFGSIDLSNTCKTLHSGWSLAFRVIQNAVNET